MAAQAPTLQVPKDAELLQAHADLWRHSLCYLTSTGLRCVIKLGIPTAIHHLGGATSLADLIAAISLPPAKLPYLRSLMRMLVTTGDFAKADSGPDGEECFRLNALSSILVDDVDTKEHQGHSSFVLAATSSHKQLLIRLEAGEN